tara:strand:+ start:264 stop:1046 length:783 start_codon:yes stop_codon:yes gene_type:complete
MSKDVERLPKNGTICLIDADSLMYYEMDKKTLEEAIAGLDQRLDTILTQCNTDRFAGFLTKGKCFRYNVAKDYKGNRKGKSKPIIFYALDQYLRQQYNFISYPELEADDLVSYYSHVEDRKTIICSPDKDVLHQCVGMHYNYRTNEFLHTSAEDANRFLWKQTLMGDSVDGIPGIPGVGAKTADNWLKDRTRDFEGFAVKQYAEKFGMIKGIHKFYETFNLVYMLRTAEDIKQATGLILPPLEINSLQIETINPNQTELW